MVDVPKLIWPPQVRRYFEAMGGRSADVRMAEATLRVHAEMLFLVRALRGRPMESVLDIGCGLALIDVMIAREFGTKHIHLLDGDGTLPRVTGFKPDTRAWADVHLGVDMVSYNVKEFTSLVAYHPTGLNPVEGRFDLIISLRSWGHHYPISSYLFLAERCLAQHGCIVVDIRNHTDGELRLEEAGFKVVAHVPDPSLKCRRLVFERR